MFERFTEPGIKVVVTAQEEARKIGNNFVGTEQILLGLIAETSGIGGRILRKYGITLKLAREEIKRLVGRGSGFVAVEIPFTPRARRVLENAIEESKTLGFPYVGPEHILLAILMEQSGIAVTALQKILRDVNPDINFDIIRKRTLREMGEEFEVEFGDTTQPLQRLDEDFRNPQSKGNIGFRNKNFGKLVGPKSYLPADIHPNFNPKSPLLNSPIINEYTQNITKMAFAGDIDPVIGRSTEVERVLQILSRRRKNNPILLGEPGVGKTAVAEGLALEIIGGYVPSVLQGKSIITLDLGLIIAGSRYRGDFEKRLKRVISDVQLTKVYILVIDEVHTLVGAGAAEGSLDAANILKPALARGEFQCIGATTLNEYRKYIEPDAALARRFQSVRVDEPSVQDTIKILVGIREKYEEHHRVKITQNALQDASVLTSRYINDRFLPDKAIDIIDEACARVRVAFEMIPDVCEEFEDQLTDIAREKNEAYDDRDWLTVLNILRDEIKEVEVFAKFLYELFDKFKQQRKIWLIRSMQQRYQFILKGPMELLKEWDIVVQLYENQKQLDRHELNYKKIKRGEYPFASETRAFYDRDIPDPDYDGTFVVQNNSLENEDPKTLETMAYRRSLQLELEIRDTKITIEKLERKLNNFREVDLKKPEVPYLKRKPLDKDGFPNNSEKEPNAGEEDEAIDPEISRIVEEIKEMKARDAEPMAPRKLIQPKESDDTFIREKSEYTKEIIAPTHAREYWLGAKEEEARYLHPRDERGDDFRNPLEEEVQRQIERTKPINKRDRRKRMSNVPPFKILRDRKDVVNATTMGMVEPVNKVAGLTQFERILQLYNVPFNTGKEKIPRAVVSAIRKKLFNDAFIPFSSNGVYDTSRQLTDFENSEIRVNKLTGLNTKTEFIEITPKPAKSISFDLYCRNFMRDRKIWDDINKKFFIKFRKLIRDIELSGDIMMIDSCFSKNKLIKRLVFVDKKVRLAMENDKLITFDNYIEDDDYPKLISQYIELINHLHYTYFKEKQNLGNDRLEAYLQDQRLWSLFSFINWNRSLIKQNLKPREKTKKTLEKQKQKRVEELRKFKQENKNWSQEDNGDILLTLFEFEEAAEQVENIDEKRYVVPEWLKMEIKNIMPEVLSFSKRIMNKKIKKENVELRNLVEEVVKIRKKITENTSVVKSPKGQSKVLEIYKIKNAEKEQEKSELSVVQISLELLQLYKKQGIVTKLNKINLDKTLIWRDLHHESLLSNLGMMLFETYKPNLPSTKSKLTREAKAFFKKDPKWLDINPDVPYNPDIPAINDNDLEATDPIVSESLIVKSLLEGEDDSGHSENSKIVAAKNKRLQGHEEEIAKMQETSKKKAKGKIEARYTPWVFSTDIAGIVSEWTGIPVAKVSKSEVKKLLNIETELKRRVIGQPEAVFAIAKALRRGRIGLRDSTRPIASFFFSGPTGVGKTEVTKALAASYFGGESDMVRFDMSEFMERHTVSKLIGSPPGYVGYNEGGQLTEAVRRKPYVVVLFDEVEKAHPDVFNLLLQVLEDGRLSDASGRVIDFKNTIIVMTSNLGAAAIQNPDKFKSEKNAKADQLAFDPSKNNDNEEGTNDQDDDPEKIETSKIKELVLEELKNFFRPEFLNRIDEIVVFRKLTKSDIKEIASIMINSLKERLSSKSYNLFLSESVIERIIEEGFDPDYGARPLRRVITNRLEDNLAAIILEKEIEPDSTIWVDYKNDKYEISHKYLGKIADFVGQNKKAKKKMDFEF